MEQFFAILNLVVPAIILALFALHYQLRKKAEIRIETEMARQRIQAYEAIHAAFGQIMHTEYLTPKQQSEIDLMRKYYRLQDFGVEYSVVLSTERNFTRFFRQTQDAVTENSILFDYDTLRQAQHAMGILSNIKSLLDAFCDAVGTYRKGESAPQNVVQRIDYAYLLTSVALKNQYNRSFIEVEDCILHQMSDIEVVPGKRDVRRAYDWISEQVMYIILSGTKLHFQPCAKICKRLSWIMMGRAQQHFCVQLQQLFHLLEYAYVSDHYSFYQYVHLPAKQRHGIHHEFLTRMGMQMHTMWTNV